MDGQLVILGEQVLYERNSFRRVRRYIKGKHPHLGPIQMGWGGIWETIWETDMLIIQHTFEVVT